MKKSGLLNQAISDLVAGMGHGDALVVSDAGLPIPKQTRRIDLALTCGLPPFLSTVEVILGELQVERATIPEELPDRNPQVYQALVKLLGTVPISKVPHEQFKELTISAAGVVRTGECTPFANVIIYSGVIF